MSYKRLPTASNTTFVQGEKIRISSNEWDGLHSKEYLLNKKASYIDRYHIRTKKDKAQLRRLLNKLDLEGLSED